MMSCGWSLHGMFQVYERGLGLLLKTLCSQQQAMGIHVMQTLLLLFLFYSYFCF